MSQPAKIRRGSQPRRSAKPKPRRNAAAKRPSLLSRAIAALPASAETIQRAVTWGTLGVVGVGLVVVAQLMGLPAMAGTELGEMAGRAGFEVKRIEVKGIDRMERLTVYAIALDQKSTAMPLVDLERVRGDLKRYGWIADARVSRRLPDTLVVDIVERKPAAIWQNNQKLALIDRDGVMLEAVAVDAMPDLPLVIGPDANRQTAGLTRLMDQAPALKPMLAGATWVGGRRWDLRFQSGETLALPEGEGPAGKALTRFARMDGVERLLGRGFVRFDMRDPTKFVVRVAKPHKAIDEIESAAPEAEAAPAPQTVEPAPQARPLGEIQRVSDTDRTI